MANRPKQETTVISTVGSSSAWYQRLMPVQRGTRDSGWWIIKWQRTGITAADWYHDGYCRGCVRQGENTALKMDIHSKDHRYIRPKRAHPHANRHRIGSSLSVTSFWNRLPGFKICCNRRWRNDPLRWCAYRTKIRKRQKPHTLKRFTLTLVMEIVPTKKLSQTKIV